MPLGWCWPSLYFTVAGLLGRLGCGPLQRLRCSKAKAVHAEINDWVGHLVGLLTSAWGVEGGFSHPRVSDVLERGNGHRAQLAVSIHPSHPSPSCSLQVSLVPVPSPVPLYYLQGLSLTHPFKRRRLVQFVHLTKSEGARASRHSIQQANASH